MMKTRLVTKWSLVVMAGLLSACGTKQAAPVVEGGLTSCLSNPQMCNEADLCRLALFEEDGVKHWYVENLRWAPYVTEANNRGLGCGVK